MENTARPDVKEILYQQLQLLAEQSKNVSGESLCMFTHSMVEVADEMRRAGLDELSKLMKSER